MKKKLRKYLIITMIAALAYYQRGPLQAWALEQLRGQPEIVQEVIEVVIPRQSFQELVDGAPSKYKIPKPIIEVLVSKESGGRMNAIRYEPHHLGRAAKITRDKDQQRMYASSHCALQVMGWWAPEFDITWADLYKPETCLEVGLTIFKRCHEKHVSSKNSVEQISKAATCYNGSADYGKDFVEKLGQHLINKNL